MDNLKVWRFGDNLAPKMWLGLVARGNWEGSQCLLRPPVSLPRLSLPAFPLHFDALFGLVFNLIAHCSDKAPFFWTFCKIFVGPVTKKNSIPLSVGVFQNTHCTFCLSKRYKTSIDLFFVRFFLIHDNWSRHFEIFMRPLNKKVLRYSSIQFVNFPGRLVNFRLKHVYISWKPCMWGLVSDILEPS